MSETAASRMIQIALAGAVLVGALVLTQVRSIGASDIVTAVRQEQAAEAYALRLEQTEMLMETGCIELATY